MQAGSERVVLSWPHKDRARRPRAPRVLTKFKRFDRRGARSVAAALPADNLLVKGDNLQVLAALKKRFAGRVKLIYIDPPYNTGGPKTAFRYNDSFSHAAWLTFMRSRLELAKLFLAKEGAIYVHLDYHEVHYCKVLLDEIFGRDNFQREIIWRIGWISGYKTAGKNWIRNHDTLLFYARDKKYLDFNKKHIPYPRGYVRRDGKKPTGQGYPYEDTWNCSELDPLNSVAIVSFSKEKVGGFKGQKNEALLRRIIEAHTREGEIVMDFFSGSGTTAAAAHKLRRQWISIEQLDGPLGKQVARLQKTVAGDRVGISRAVGWKGGGSFVCCRLTEANNISYPKRTKIK